MVWPVVSGSLWFGFSLVVIEEVKPSFCGAVNGLGGKIDGEFCLRVTFFCVNFKVVIRQKFWFSGPKFVEFIRKNVRS